MAVGMTGYYRVRIDVGPYSWHIAQGDPPAYGPTDGLEIGWAFEEGQSRPQQPQPVTARFGVIVEHALEFYVDIGDPVTIAVFTDPVGTVPPPGPFGYLPPIATFAGRITDLEAIPHALGTVFRLQAVDYLADLIALQGYEFGGEPTRVNQAGPGSADNYALDYSARDFIVALAARNGLPNPWPLYPFYPPDDSAIWALHTLGTGLDSMFNHYRRVLQSWLLRDGNAVGTSGLAGVIVPQVEWDVDNWTAVPLADQPHGIQLIPRERRTWFPSSLPPGMLTDGEGAHIVIDTNDYPSSLGWPYPFTPEVFGVIDADTVELSSANWRRSKSQAVDTTELGWRSAGDGLGNGGATHVYRQANSVDTVPTVRSLGDVHAYNFPEGQIRTLAAFHLPEYGEGSARYQADAFRVRPALGNPWVFSRIGYAMMLSPYSALQDPVVAIRDIPPRWNPNSSSPTYYAGSLVGAKLVIQDSDYYVDIVLESVVPRPTYDPGVAGNTYESYASFRARPVPTNYRQVDRSVSYESARIIRRR